MKKLEGQLEMALPELDRPKWKVCGEYPTGRTVESCAFDTEEEATDFKKELAAIDKSAIFKVVQIDG